MASSKVSASFANGQSKLNIFKPVFFKLLVVLIATIPMAAIAAALLVGANVTSQFIVSIHPRHFIL
jgi:hypothetical protein